MPAAWTECRRCGASLAPAPAPVGAPAPPAPAPPAVAARLAALPVPAAPPSPFATAAPPPPEPHSGFGAPDDALLPGAPRPRPATPDTLLPAEPVLIRAAPARTSRLNPTNLAIAALVTVLVVGAALTLRPHGHKKSETPTILAARPPLAGIPTSLGEVVRIAAESARHTAMSTVISAAGNTGAAVTTAQLAAAQPSYQWLDGMQASTTDTEVSITSQPGLDVIAVAGTNKEICAFARWTPTAGSTYVTMDHDHACAAANAPVDGWSTLPGGSAQDLPSEDGT